MGAMGFTELTPAQIDELGGLPAEIERTGKSLVMSGNGTISMRSQESHYEGSITKGGYPPGEIKFLNKTEPLCNYAIAAGDNVEMIWGKGFMEMQCNGDTIFKVQDKQIDPPPKKSAYAIVDCSHAVCKMTLMG